MKEVDVSRIKETANAYRNSGDSWHFHILTPQCLLNNSDKYALILECAGKETLACYSDEPYMDIGQELVKMLHGDEIMDKEDKSLPTSLSDEIKGILKRANELSNKGVLWHHHMLFPGCMFNGHRGQWVIMLEDKEKGESLKAVYDKEPKFDLAALELLFYQQKKAE